MAQAPVDQRYAPPLTHVVDVGPSEGADKLATRKRRLAGALIDAAILMGALFLIAPLIGFDLMSQEAQAIWQNRLLGGVAGVALFAIVQAYPLLRRGQTIGKMMVKTRITRPDGSLASAGRLALRYCIGLPFSVFPLGAQIYAVVDCLAIFRTSRRCLHDSIADTEVFKI